MLTVETMLLIVTLFGLYMAWNIGANDVANSMGTCVGSGAVSVRQAIIIAALCEFAGATLAGSHVTDTVRRGIIDPRVLASIPGVTEREAAALFVIGMAAALLASGIWLNVATWFGMPVSTTHSIVGAVAGFGIAAVGWHAVEWGKMTQIVASWFISPVAGGVLAFLIFKTMNIFILGRPRPIPAGITGVPIFVFVVMAVVFVATLYKGMGHILKGGKFEWLTGDSAFLVAAVAGLVTAAISKAQIRRRLKGKESLPLSEQLHAVERVFAPLVIISSCSVAFSHGANDVANSIGPLAAISDIMQSGSLRMKVQVPLWVLAVGGTGIVLGLATYGYKVMETMGKKITELSPSRGVAANIASMIVVLVCTRMKLPVSTTHTIVGAVIGIGLARGLMGVNKAIAKDITAAWFVTVPAAAILAVLLYTMGRLFLLRALLQALP